MSVKIRTGTTFARAVYADHFGIRGKTAWWARRHMLDDDIRAIRTGNPPWTILYVERCKLREASHDPVDVSPETRGVGVVSPGSVRR